VQFFDVHEQVVRAADLGLRAGKGADRIDELAGAIGRPARFTIVAVLVLGAALRARPLDKAIGQEGAGFGIEQLGHLLLDDQSGFAKRSPELRTKLAVFGTVRAAVVVELDVEPGEVFHVGLLHPGDQLFLRDPFLLRADHDRRAVRVVGTHVNATLPPQLLEADPDVGL
jgi:hypothetical protein